MRHLRRKLTLRAHDEQIVVVKRPHERIEHVWMKAFIWALYLPSYPDLSVEVSIGDRYKPDVVMMDSRRGRPLFWGEAGHVGRDKTMELVDRYTDTHLAIAKWDTDLDLTLEPVERALHETRRSAPIDFLSFPPDSGSRFIDDTVEITVSWDAITWIRVSNAKARS